MSNDMSEMCITISPDGQFFLCRIPLSFATKTVSMKLTARVILASTLTATALTASAVDLTKVTCNVPVTEFREALLQATNDARSKGRFCGSQFYAKAAPLRWNGRLAKAARNHSRDMAINNFFSHTGSDGLQVWDRAVNAGFNYNYIGENIAAGYTTAASTQSGWEKSPGHCRNIMNPNYVVMGARCITRSNSDYQRYWTVVFGKRL